MTAPSEKLRQEIRHETRRIVLETLIAAAALIGVGIALAKFFVFHG